MGNFDLSLILPPNYPFKPPTVTFTTKIYHPNISNDTPPNSGTMCLGMLKDSDWKPSTKMSAVLEFTRQLLKGEIASLSQWHRHSQPSQGRPRYIDRFLTLQNRTQMMPSRPKSPTSIATTAPRTREKPKSGLSDTPAVRNELTMTTSA